MGDIAMLIEQFGAWAFVAIFAGFLLKYVIMDLRKDNERNYAMAGKLHKRFDEWIASTDRRTDKIWTEWHNLNDRVKQLDKIINPNKDLVN